jgi:ABC-type uncharacterized transport system substrate-binding protein
MQITIPQLIEVINRLPNEEYRVVILQEPKFIFNNDIVPDLEIKIEELRFVKNYEYKQWCLIID